MSLKDRLLPRPRRSALDEAVARLEQLERSLSGRPVIQIQGATRADEPRGYLPSPDEEWSRKFMNQGIGPKPEFAPLRNFRPGYRLAQLRGGTVLKTQMSFAPENAQPGPIGRAVGKYVEPRRSLFSRLFGRR